MYKRALLPMAALLSALSLGLPTIAHLEENQPPPLTGNSAVVIPPTPRLLSQAADDALVDAAFLRGVLPASTFAYLRLPSAWGLLGAPKGNVLDPALRSAPYAAAVQTIRGGTLENLLPALPDEIRGIASVLLGHLHSPLELAVFAPSGNSLLLPDWLVTATLESADLPAVNALLTTLTNQIPGWQLQRPLEADGTAQLLAGTLPVEVYVDSTQRRLFIGFANPAGQPLPLAQRSAGLTPNPKHPMVASEQSLDASGQGLFLWLNPASLLRALEAVGPVQEIAMLRAFGAAEAQAVAVGIGSSGGKQRIKLVLDMPQVGVRAFLPAVHTDLPFKTAGSPETVFMLGLPSAGDLTRLEHHLEGLMPAESLREYQNLKTQLTQTLGVSLEQYLSAFGTELMLIYDQAGHYVALRLRDQAAYPKILEQMAQRFGLHHETHTLLGTTFHHLVLPDGTPLDQAEPLANESNESTASLEALATRAVTTPNHLYWIEENGYLLLSSVPQTLMDYLYIPNKVVLSDWLRQNQGVDPSEALFLATTRSDGVPRMMYEVDLWLLSYLGDLAGRPVDLFSLPSPHELNLPKSGAYSLQLTAGPNQLGLELVYESNPLEGLMAIGGLQTALFAGGLTAAILPAYSHYLDQASLQQALLSLHETQLRLAEFYVANGHFPTAADVESFLEGDATPDSVSLQLEPDTGQLYAIFSLPGLESGNDITLTPEVSENGMLWHCSGNLDPKYLSVLCAAP